jgi:arylsulfatase A-like enzyme
VPFMAMQVGTVAAGQVRSVPVSVIDILPTVLNAVGASPTQHLDGRDILGIISADRPLVFSDIQDNGAAIRKGRWKLLKDYDGIH